MQNADEETTGTLPGHDGTRLFFRQFPPRGEVSAGIVIAHGLGEHSGRYTALAERLADNGILVTAVDHRGHGRSNAKRGYVRRFSDYTTDLEIILEKCRDQVPENCPVFILGHSLGGLMVLNFAMQSTSDRIGGVIASSPALATSVEIPRAKAAAGRILSRIWPAISFDNELAPEYLSHDNEVVKNYVSDHLVHRRVSARLFTEMMDTMQRTRENPHLITVPVLMQVAGDDKFTDPDSARNFFKGISAQDKVLYSYNGLFHEIYNETREQRQRVIADLEDWLRERIRR
ncbi:MAG: alpha/beta hydrolase [Thermodesulfobacteriota bacterium]